ncbi:MAG: PKD domain-containing protein, partial [Bacteroidota bacterium]
MLFFPRLKLAIALLLLTFVASANRIVVFGTVNFPGGAAAINYPLTIQPDSTLCLVKKSIVTNQSGAFETVIECDKNVLKAIISYIDCEGRLVQLVKEEPATLKVEYNIILCAPLNCQAAFNYVISTSNPLKLEFSSNNSHASGPATDEIITRNWSWGDGTPIENANLANITHLFTKPGNYEVCLKIVTRNGCHSYLCKTITIPGSELHCEAAFRFEKVIGETSNPPK